MPLEWTEHFDDNDNSYWEALSPYTNDGPPIMWRIRQRLGDNRIEYYEDHDQELLQHAPDYWITLGDAQEAIEKAHRNIIEDNND